MIQMHYRDTMDEGKGEPIRDLVGMTSPHRFGCEEESSGLGVSDGAHCEGLVGIEEKR